MPLTIKKTRLIYWVLLLMLSLANVWIIVHRNDGFRYKAFKTYTQLYTTDSSLYLKELNFSKDSLQLILSLPLHGKQFLLQVDNQKNRKAVAINSQSNTITFPIQKDKHTYTLNSIDTAASPIVIIADHDSISSPNYINEFSYCSLAGPHISVSTLEEYKTGYGFYTDKEIVKAKDILYNKIKLHLQATDSAKTMAIAAYAASLCSNTSGTHFRDLALLRASQQLDSALLCRGYLACGNYAAIITYFASVAGLPNRVICYEGPTGNWQYAAHYLNEIYLREKQQWVLLDGVSNIYLPQDSNGNYINIVDIKKMVQTNTCKGKTAYRFYNGMPQKVLYDSINTNHVYYNRSNANIGFVKPNIGGDYSFLKNFVDFYRFNEDGVLYSDVNTNNWCKIVAKMITAALFLIVLVLYALFEIIAVVERKKVQSF